MKKHHYIYHLFMKVTLALGIILALIGIEFGFIINSRFENNVKKEISDLILVNKSPIIEDYFMTEIGFAFNEEDYKKINKLKHIKNYYEYLKLDYSTNYVFTDAKKMLHDDNLLFGNVTMYIDLNEKNIPIQFPVLVDEEQGVSQNFEIVTYPNEIDFDYRVEEKWNDEGVYVSQDFYQKYIEKLIETNGDKMNLRLTLPLYVPVYNSRGIVRSGSSEAQSNTYAGIVTPVQFKVKGILKDSVLIETGSDGNWNFALSNKEFQVYLNKFKVDEKHSCFWHSDLEKFICDEPRENYFSEITDEIASLNYLVDFEPYKTNCIVVQVDDVKYLRDVKNELEKLGYNTYCGSLDGNEFITAQENIHKTIFLVGIITFLFILLMNLFLKLNNREEEKSFQDFFREKNLL